MVIWWKVTEWKFILRFIYFFVSEVAVTHLCQTLCDPIDYTVHGILQDRILEWVAYPFSRGFSWPRNGTGVSCIAGRFFTNWAIREALIQFFNTIFKGYFPFCGASFVAQRVKRLSAIWETWVRFLGGEDPLEKEIATHSSTLPCLENPMDGGAW